MIKLYYVFEKKVGCGDAVLYSLMLNIFFWFLIGSCIGAVLALLLGKLESMVSYGVTLGACCSLVLGYVWGYIRLLRSLG